MNDKGSMLTAKTHTISQDMSGGGCTEQNTRNMVSVLISFVLTHMWKGHSESYS